MRGLRKLSVVLLAGCMVFAAGCATEGALSKENIGTALGGVVGGVLGSKVGGGSGKTVATITGTMVGASLGKAIGAMLDERDRQALAQRTQQALANAKDGETTSWKSGHSGANATITPVSTSTRSQDVAVKRTPKVQAVPNMKLLNQMYRAKTDANVRAAPTADAERAGGLAGGTTFTAVGRTDNGWIMVGRKGVSIGYVSGKLVEPADTPTATAQADASTDLDAMDTAQVKSQGFDLDAAPVEETVAMQTSCRTLRTSVEADGSTEQKDVRACQSPDGSWDLG